LVRRSTATLVAQREYLRVLGCRGPGEQRQPGQSLGQDLVQQSSNHGTPIIECGKSAGQGYLPDSRPGHGKAKKAKAVKIKPSKEDAAAARRILDASTVADVALFGRMIADNKDFNVDAASQVAHAISTHAVVNEYDYYTAVDDLKPDAESGADMIGTVDFNSACYYRYANLDLDRLTTNLGGDTDLAARAASAWLSAFIHAVPSGKQNSMAARTMPDTLLGVVRDHGAWNLANAFLSPVTDADLMAGSTQRMVDHFTKLRGFYGTTAIRQVAAASVTGDLMLAADEEIAPTLDAFTSRVLAGVQA
jgi:CRISPR system Cascade subunit CasC